MASPINQILDSIPSLSLISLLTAIVFLISGWITSVLAGYRSANGKRLRIFLIIPPTNPIALFILFVRDRKAAIGSVLCYTIALIALPLGGMLSSTFEQGKLTDYTTQINQTGESINIDDLKPTPVPENQNIWMHPFLKTMADAATLDEVGRAALVLIGSAEDSPYKPLYVPERNRGLRLNYRDEDALDSFRSTQSGRNALRRLHHAALSIIAKRDGKIDDSNKPKDWKSVGEIISTYYLPTAYATKQLEEAIQRPADQYPYEWDKASQMLLPHLSNLKSLSQGATLRSQAAAMTGNTDEAFRMIRLGQQLVETGDSDFLISRLVQFAQSMISANAIRVAQQLHIGTDAQWLKVSEALDRLDFPSLIVNVIRAERAFGHASIGPIMKTDIFGITSQIGALGGGSGMGADSLSPFERGSRAIASLFLSGNAQAIVKMNWRMGLEAYGELIQNTKDTVEKTKTHAWNECIVPPLSRKIRTYGIFAAMLIPALDSAINKAVDAQHLVALTKTAISLERFYIANSAYPESLTELEASAQIDPMTQSPWKYERLERKGFLLYSVGRNGIDEGGNYRSGINVRETSEDDRAWHVDPNIPALPEFTLRTFQSKENSSEMSPDMRRRYGLQPADIGPKGVEAKIPETN
jgi:hypothetical protein